MIFAAHAFVSIGLPTYNRFRTLARAIESALAQTHRHLELVISDNASSDDTEAVCRRYARADERVRYVRHPTNRGPTANFNYLFANCRGDHVLMLADDDWLDASYVSRCLEEMQRRPGHVLVGGLPLYYRDARRIAEGVEVQLPHADPRQRVLEFYRQVEDNGTFYGVMRSQALAAAGPMTNVLGNDWYQLAALAFQGPVLTLRDTHIHRDLGGTSVGLESIRATFGRRGGVEARIPHLFMAARAASDIAWRRPLYRSLGLRQRLGLALRVIPPVISWRASAWHLVVPGLATLSRRPRGRRLWSGFLRLARAMGAGRTPLGPGSTG